MTNKNLPFFAVGQVVKGFGRGSKELGIPTANLPETVVEKLPTDITTGIYYGLANIDKGPVHKMVMSIGWNPFYSNKKKSMETHILHTFEEDFYGSQLRIIMLGYIRPEKNFNSLDELITAIKDDISKSHDQLNKPEYEVYWKHKYFIEENVTDMSDSLNLIDIKKTETVNDSNKVNGYEPDINHTTSTDS